MKKILWTLLFFLMFNIAFSLDLENVRINYEKAVRNEKICRSILDKLTHFSDKTIYQGYLGAYQAIWANHTINPFSKINTFNSGKKNIEQAIKVDPNNIELRYLRLSIQKNCPAFLGYTKNIEEDISFIRKHADSITDESLKQMCKKIIL
jgi:hypothetical protein